MDSAMLQANRDSRMLATSGFDRATVFRQDDIQNAKTQMVKAILGTN